MACPFFMPTHKSEDIAWLHPSRLPLGAGWNGQCCAPGHESSLPAPDEIRDNCNLGYAATCPRLPHTRDCDAVRFSIVRASASRLVVCFVRELGHLPVEHGVLEYEIRGNAWTSRHPNPMVQKMAECYVQSYLGRRSEAVQTGGIQASQPAN